MEGAPGIGRSAGGYRGLEPPGLRRPNGEIVQAGDSLRQAGHRGFPAVGEGGQTISPDYT